MGKLNIQEIIQKFNIQGIFKNIIPKNISLKPASLLIIDLSSGIKMIDVELSGVIRVNALKVVNLPAENIEKNIQEAILNFIKENNITHKNAVLRPLLKTLVIKRLQLPVVPAAELPQVIKWQIKDEVKFDVSNAVLDYQVIRKSAKADGTEVFDIICAAADEKEVSRQVLMLKQIGLSCVSVNFLAFGYAKIIEKFIEKSADEAIGVLHLDEDVCSIGFYKNNKFDFYRELPLSINKIRQALSSELVTQDKEIVRLSAEDIEDLLFKSGIPLGDAKYKDKLNSGQIMALLRPSLELLVQEIKRSFVYYDSQFKQGQVKKMFVNSKAAGIVNFEDVLKSEFSLDTVKFPFIEKFEFSNKIDKNEVLENYAALGMAIDFENNINLLPNEFKAEKIEMLQKFSLRWVAFIACILLVVSFVFAKVSTGGYQKRLDNAVLHLNVLSQVKETKQKLDSFNVLINDIRNLDVPAGSILKKFSNIVPAMLYFEAFDMDCQAKTGKIMGYVKSYQKNPDTILTGFVDAMNDSYIFKDVNVATVEKTSMDKEKITRFQVTFSLL
ncbi:MAG: pilus assembly protein PilM [Candidatus Omnitrophota bacterium]